MSKGTYSFTTPIYYVNAAPHLGTAYTTIAADTVAISTGMQSRRDEAEERNQYQ